MSTALVVNLILFCCVTIYVNYESVWDPEAALQRTLLHPEGEATAIEKTLLRLTGFWSCFAAAALLFALRSELFNGKFLINTSIAVLVGNVTLWYLWHKELDLSDLKLQVADDASTMHSVLLSCSIVTLCYHWCCSSSSGATAGRTKRVVVGHKV